MTTSSNLTTCGCSFSIRSVAELVYTGRVVKVQMVTAITVTMKKLMTVQRRRLRTCQKSQKCTPSSSPGYAYRRGRAVGAGRRACLGSNSTGRSPERSPGEKGRASS